MMIIVTPTARRPGRYDARLGDGRVLVTASKQPFVDAARRLIDLGYDPDHRAGRAACWVRHRLPDGPAGEAAKLAVKEDRGRPGLFSGSRCRAGLRRWRAQKPKGLPEQPSTTPTNPARDPAQQSLLNSRRYQCQSRLGPNGRAQHGVGDGGAIVMPFRDWQPRYAAHGIATFPVRVGHDGKVPAIRGWQRVGLPGSAKLVAASSRMRTPSAFVPVNAAG